MVRGTLRTFGGICGLGGVAGAVVAVDSGKTAEDAAVTRTRLTLDCLDDRALPSTGIGDLIALGADAGGQPQVNLLDTAGNSVGGFLAYDPAFTGGVRVALGDATGDGRADIVTAAGPGGGPQVNVYDGRDGRLVRSFFAYEPQFRGGVTVAVGVLGGRPVIVTGRGAGGPPEVRVFDGTGGGPLLDFNAYEPSFTGGVNVAVGDVFGTGGAQIVTAPGAGGGPRVSVFSGTTGQTLANFFAYEPQFRGGVSVATGSLAGVIGRDAVVTGAGPGGGPRVSVLDATTGQTLQTAFAYDPAFTGGVNVGVLSGTTGRPDRLVTAAGPGGGPQVNVYPGLGPVAAAAAPIAPTAPTPAILPTAGAFGTPASFFALPVAFSGGVGLGTGFGVAPIAAPALGVTAVNTFAGPLAAPAGTASSLVVQPSSVVAPPSSLTVGSAGVVNSVGSAGLGPVGSGTVSNVGGTIALGVGTAGIVNPVGNAGLGTVGIGTVNSIGGAGDLGVGTATAALPNALDPTAATVGTTGTIGTNGTLATNGLSGVVTQGVPLGSATAAGTTRVPYIISPGFYSPAFGQANPATFPGPTNAAQLDSRFRYRVG
jgi:hypothetical protein